LGRFAWKMALRQPGRSAMAVGASAEFGTLRTADQGAARNL